MFDILTALLGRWSCPWCTGRDIRLYGWFYNTVVPAWLSKRLSSYDSWVGRVGGGWHHAHHIADQPDYDPCEGHSD